MSNPSLIIFFLDALMRRLFHILLQKKTVFKWQEEFWQKMKKVFDSHYKKKFNEAGLLKDCGGELQHYLSDVASMKLTVWTKGGFGMCSHNYDGDVLTDELAQVHKSPGFLTSVLTGINDDGSVIKEFEASHGTVTDMWNSHLRGEEASLNPLSMMEALIGAIQHSVILNKGPPELHKFALALQKEIHTQMTTPGRASRDLSGPSGLTTEQFTAEVRKRLESIIL